MPFTLECQAECVGRKWVCMCSQEACIRKSMCVSVHKYLRRFLRV